MWTGGVAVMGGPNNGETRAGGSQHAEFDFDGFSFRKHLQVLQPGIAPLSRSVTQRDRPVTQPTVAIRPSGVLLVLINDSYRFLLNFNDS